MDKKGFQLGRGQRASRRTFIFPGFTYCKDWYHISSNNLELVTIIEYILAAGDSMSPSFVIKGEGQIPSPEDIDYELGMWVFLLGLQFIGLLIAFVKHSHYRN